MDFRLAAVTLNRKRDFEDVVLEKYQLNREFFCATDLDTDDRVERKVRAVVVELRVVESNILLSLCYCYCDYYRWDGFLAIAENRRVQFTLPWRNDGSGVGGEIVVEIRLDPSQREIRVSARTH